MWTKSSNHKQHSISWYNKSQSHIAPCERGFINGCSHGVIATSDFLIVTNRLYRILPAAYEVWGKVLFSQVCVCHSFCSQGVVGVWSVGVGVLVGIGVWAGGGCLVGGGFLVSAGGCLVGGVLGVSQWDSHCCGKYASYWNAFLYVSITRNCR